MSAPCRYHSSAEYAEPFVVFLSAGLSSEHQSIVKRVGPLLSYSGKSDLDGEDTSPNNNSPYPELLAPGWVTYFRKGNEAAMSSGRSGQKRALAQTNFELHANTPIKWGIVVTNRNVIRTHKDMTDQIRILMSYLNTSYNYYKVQNFVDFSCLIKIYKYTGCESYFFVLVWFCLICSFSPVAAALLHGAAGHGRNWKIAVRSHIRSKVPTTLMLYAARMKKAHLRRGEVLSFSAVGRNRPRPVQRIKDSKVL